MHSQEINIIPIKIFFELYNILAAKYCLTTLLNVIMLILPEIDKCRTP